MPDYKNYTIEELRDIINNIDKDSYPERYASVKTLIEEHSAKNDKVERNIDSSESNKSSLFDVPNAIRVSNGAVWPTRTIFLLIACYLLNKSYWGYVNEKIFIHRDYWSLSEDSFIFWFAIVGFVIAASGFLWQLFRVEAKP